jgi:Pathogenicity locus
MNPSKVDRSRVKVLTDLPNIGRSVAMDLESLGIHTPQQLVGESPFDLYEALCLKTGLRHDPCVIDVFMSITRFMDGDEPRPWWAFTEERKRLLKEKSLNPTLSD